jgi:putative two-component system response regulator
LVESLRDEYVVKAAINGEMALKIVQKSQPDLILLDVMMPGIDGFEVCRQLKANYITRHIPVIFVTAMIGTDDEIKGLSLGAVDYITKPISPPIVRARVKTHLALADQNLELEHKVQERTKQLEETRLQIIQRLGRAAEYKDNETGLHVIRMSLYAYELAIAAGMSEADANLLKHAAPMHDIGKIGIPDEILKKKGRLNDEELIIMRTHSQIGAEIIGDDASDVLKLAKTVALTHHEKWDGTGYPNGLAGEQIPSVGRIVAIADVFDALTSERPYKKAWTVTEAFSYMNEQAGSHFDPYLMAIFLSISDKILEIQHHYAETRPLE